MSVPENIPDIMARTSDKTLAESFFAEFHQELQDYLARRLSRTEDVRDLVQEVFLRFLRIEQSQLVDNPQAFLYGIASNIVLERRRRNQHQRITFNSNAADYAAEHPAHVVRDELAESLFLERQIECAAQELTPTQLRILTFWRRDGLSFDAIGELLKLSPHTVKKYAAQAIAVIRMGCR